MLHQSTNYHFNYTIGIDNSIEKVWNYLISVEHWKDWDTALVSSTLFGKFEVGAKGELKPQTGPLLPFHISEIIPKKSYTFKTKMLFGYLEIKRTLLEKEGKVFFTDDIQFTGILKRLFGLILGGGFKKLLPEVMGNFKRQAEAL